MRTTIRQIMTFSFFKVYVPAADDEGLLKLFALYKNLLIFMMSLNLK